MMRIPLPVALAALVVAAAGSVLLTAYFKSDAPYVINATSLEGGQNMTVTLSYIPSKIMVYGAPSAWYLVTIYANATFVVPDGEMAGFTYSGVYRTSVQSGQTVQIKVVEARDTRAKIVVVRWA